MLYFSQNLTNIDREACLSLFDFFVYVTEHDTRVNKNFR